MKDFFNKNFKKKMNLLNITKFKNMTYEELGVDLDIVKSLIIGDNTTLLNSQNAIDFVFYNYTRNLYSVYKKFNIQTLDQLTFFSEYFINFIPNTYCNPIIIFKVDNIKHISYGNKISNALVSLIPLAINLSIEKLMANIEPVLISRTAYHKFKSEKSQINCVDLFMSVTKNNLERVNKICSNDLINLQSYQSIKKWVFISDCLNAYCKEVEKNQLKEISGLSDVIL